MAARFNSPPGWPVPPEGWVPPSGWTRPSEWPHSPPGWQFWVDDVTGEPVADPAAPKGARRWFKKKRYQLPIAAFLLMSGCTALLPDAAPEPEPAAVASVPPSVEPSPEPSVPTARELAAEEEAERLEAERVAAAAEAERVAAEEAAAAEAERVAAEEAAAAEAERVAAEEAAAAEAERVAAEEAAASEDQDANVYYENCDAVRAAGASPIRVGDPGWDTKFDRDGDGQGCGED